MKDFRVINQSPPIKLCLENTQINQLQVIQWQVRVSFQENEILEFQTNKQLQEGRIF